MSLSCFINYENLLTVKNNVLITALCANFLEKNIHQHVDLLSLLECNFIQYLR